MNEREKETTFQIGLKYIKVFSFRVRSTFIGSWRASSPQIICKTNKKPSNIRGDRIAYRIGNLCMISMKIDYFCQQNTCSNVIYAEFRSALK